MLASEARGGLLANTDPRSLANAHVCRDAVARNPKVAIHMSRIRIAVIPAVPALPTAA